jgi:hypothetical protein
MHEEAGLLDDIGEIRACKCEILEGTCETPVERGVFEGITIGDRKFGAGINGCSNWLTV